MEEYEKRAVSSYDILRVLERIEYSMNGYCPLCRCAPPEAHKSSNCPVSSIRERISKYGLRL